MYKPEGPSAFKDNDWKSPITTSFEAVFEAEDDPVQVIVIYLVLLSATERTPFSIVIPVIALLSFLTMPM